ncbi:neuronal acetylcholine receptor subunit alpha-2 [Drosophila albomicans]|uniref:Neuronal acetylcholine receptor subunit alpha-2 n=1 Tax=Drosophila albomicans TaxID=7291 RepID=A0A6P8WDG2_DROAB|nr:neuronal acetylcholine receptor subunit alpha-2 [Drosophila albomicans]
MSRKIKTEISGRGLPLFLQRAIGTMAMLMMGCMLISVPGATSLSDDDGAVDDKANISTIEKLQLNIFINYDEHTQPTVGGQPTNISLGLSVNYIDIDELDGKITLHCWLNARWKDESHIWNASEYDNITKVHMSGHKLWKPQITLFNSAVEEGNFLVSTQLILSSDGSVLWVTPAVYTAYCSLNMRNWPYDEQTCKLKIGTWSMNHIDAVYNKENHELNYENVVESTEWEILSGLTKFVHKDIYNYIEFTFRVKRRSSMYTAVIYTPAICIVILALSTFWLPPQMGEKILLNGILIVLISAFLMYFAQLLPVLAENTPLIVVFYSASLLLLSLSMIIEVVVLYLATAQHKRRLPDFLKNLLNGKLGTWLFLSYFSNESESMTARNGNGIIKELDDHVYENADEPINPLDINSEVPSARALQYDWVLLATAVDRICFLGFGLVFAVLCIVYGV